MKVKLFDFQDDALDKLRNKTANARSIAKTSDPQVIVFSAPTGAGKTVIMTQLFEDIFFGGDGGFEAQPDAAILWVSDMPELNEQTRLKIERMSTRIKTHQLVTIDAAFDAERLEGGNVYFINTQKLGKDKKLTSKGDGRTWAIWETFANTAQAMPDRFYVVIDEAHRGMLGNKQAQEARTLMQRFVLGFPDVHLPKMSLVVGVSATPKRFEDLLANTTHSQHKVTVTAEDVRDSGLLKDRVVIHFPEQETTADMSLLAEAAKRWIDTADKWDTFCEEEGIQAVRPILLVQVENGNENTLTKTDLADALRTIEHKIGRKLGPKEVCHAMQESGDLDVNGWKLRKVEASRIQDDPDVGVVFFKTSLSTGWDCPRAEVMMSFRAAEDHTYIAQLMGRMVRTPLARRIERVAELNDVHLYLPRFNKEAVEKVIEDLKDPENIPPSETGTDRELVILHRREGMEAVFEALETAGLVTYRVNAARAQKHLKRLMGLTMALATDEIDIDARDKAKADIVKWMNAELAKLRESGEFEAAEKNISGVGLTTLTLEGMTETKAAEEGYRIEASVADIERQFEEAGRQLTSGLHMTYWETHGDRDALEVKTEAIILASHHAAMTALEKQAEAEFDKLYDKYKAKIGKLREHRKKNYERLRLATTEPSTIDWTLPDTIDFRRPPKAPIYDRHLYVEDDGQFRADLGNWEKAVIEEELSDKETVAWLRNGVRRPWALEIPYLKGGGLAAMFPDFLVIERKGKDYLFSILEPHNPAYDDNVGKVRGLAEFAKKHGDVFDRIEWIRELPSPAGGKTFRRLNLNREAVRKKVAQISEPAHLDKLFETDAS